MDARTGQVYPSLKLAKVAGVPDEHLVELHGTEAAVQSVARAVQQQRATERRRKASKAARAARRGKRS